MDIPTMVSAFGCTEARARLYVDAMNAAMLAAGCTTERRAAMWCAQVGHETLSLIYQREIHDGSDYEGRRDLGNVQAGDGRRFPGRGWIQLTGRGLARPPSGYTGFSLWCHARGLVPTPDHFVRNPGLVELVPWSGLAASWYWTVARPAINGHADRGDVRAVTKLINGGTNGLADREARYATAIRLGPRLLPTPTNATATPGRDEFDMASLDELRQILREVVPRAVWEYPIPDYFTDRQDDAMPAYASLAWATAHPAAARDAINGARVEIAALSAALARATQASSTPLTGDDVARLLTEALAKVGPLYLAADRPAA